MKRRPLLVYLVILAFLCAALVAGARALGPRGTMLVQAYMLTPAVAAALTRIFFYEPKFRDANLRFGRWRDYLTFWLAGVGITALSYLIYTLLGSIAWDPSGNAFLDNLSKQFALAGKNMEQTLPPGFTPKMMLGLFFVGGLTVFNILPGLITGFGEEFGHRGFMFILLYRVRPWVGFVAGGLLWYAWHLPLALVAPSANKESASGMLLNHAVLSAGSVLAFVYLAYVYVKSRSVFVTALAHITMNNSSASFSYFVTVKDQLLANTGMALTMLIVVGFLLLRGELSLFRAYFRPQAGPPEDAPATSGSGSNGLPIPR